ncbi:MAG: hypothetical protein ACJ788_05275, partial [Ktedonobacteraceae bacterium]
KIVTLPPSDARPSRAMPRRPHFKPLHTTPSTSYSIPAPAPTRAPFAPQPALPPESVAPPSFSQEVVQDRATDFASHTWDLATGGLKALTAKRELPGLPERRPPGNLEDTSNVPRNYMFMLIILVCVLLMLISGGVVLFTMLQP